MKYWLIDDGVLHLVTASTEADAMRVFRDAWDGEGGNVTCTELTKADAHKTLINDEDVGGQRRMTFYPPGYVACSEYG